MCDEFRQDLKDSKIGTGNAGFRLELPVELVGNDIPVELFIAGGKTLIASAKISIIQEEQMIETPETPLEPQEPIKVEEPVKIEKPVETKPKTPAAKSKPAPKKPAPKPAEYKGRLEIASANEVRGWVVNLNDKGSVFDVDVLVGGVYYASVRNDTERSDLRRVGMSNGRGGVSVTFPKGLFSGGTVEVALRLPSGELLNKSVESTQPVSPIWPAKAKQETPVSIVVPIYNALEDVEICLENLLAYTTQDARLILINDASPDPEIAKLLKTYSKHSNIEVLTNKKNMGFTRTVNRGIKEAGTDDVIFLNSDARVTPKWLEGLRAAVASDPRIATVTPLSDRAGAFSAPNIGNNNKLPFGVTEPEYARLVRRESLRVYPTVPTGNGFCMYVRRACIDEVGPLDEKAFPRGYGEENDFCMRARALGWRNIIDDATYVYHERSKSFGSDKTELMEAGRTVVDERHPDYKHAIKVYGQGSQVLLSRYRARRAMHRCIDDQSASRSRVLFVTSTATGGTPQTNLDLMRALSGDWDAWMLRCDSHQLILSRLVDGVLKPVKSHTLEEPVSPTIHTSFEYDNVVSTWLAENDFDLVHIRQLIWHSISLPRIAKEAGAVVINSFHDYYTICPSTKMLDVDGKFHESVCEHPKGFEVSDLWPAGSLPNLTEDWMSIWRKRFTDALEICDAFVTTSPSARDRIAQFMPKEMADKFVVIPHGRDFQRFHQSSQWPDPDEKF
ncbi:glycosyltransferase, partial [Planktotalea sp.]|uniref:glycosyltransferase n=1 Tax=Planktotalea sp. TaxID=2029877 RepID=UPI00329A3D51